MVSPVRCFDLMELCLFVLQLLFQLLLAEAQAFEPLLQLGLLDSVLLQLKMEPLLSFCRLVLQSADPIVTFLQGLQDGNRVRASQEHPPTAVDVQVRRTKPYIYARRSEC